MLLERFESAQAFSVESGYSFCLLRRERREVEDEDENEANRSLAC